MLLRSGPRSSRNSPHQDTRRHPSDTLLNPIHLPIIGPDNPLKVILAETGQGRGVVDGFMPKGVETEGDIAWRKGLLRQLGYKL
jgi:hypothetical protein